METVNHAAMSFQQNLKLLSLLLKGNHEAAAELLRNGAVQPAEFARFLNQHNLQLFVFSLLGGSPIRKSFPQEWLDEIKSSFLRQWPKQEILIRELGRISTLLTAARHEFLLLKGPYLAERFFGGIDRRLFSDLDILIRRTDLAAVERLLRSCGYIRKSTFLISRALTAHFTHAFDFVKPKVTLDLHWALSANAAHSLDYDAIWRQRQTFALGNHNFFVLSDEYELVFNLISIFKDLERGAARLKAFVDLYFILNAFSCRFDWEHFLHNRKREKIRQISINVLVLFLDFFDCRERFPEIARAIAREGRLVKHLPSERFQSLIEASPGALRNKAWAAGIYECSRMHVFLWWLVSLPFRLAVHDSGGYTRFS
ncbi:MAG TPA: nucleotidyltransferase family protein [Candidatus Binatia bacterium]|jgi:hypothetical protein